MDLEVRCVKLMRKAVTCIVQCDSKTIYNIMELLLPQILTFRFTTFGRLNDPLSILLSINMAVMSLTASNQ